jgi:hypothetical protein
MWLITGQMTGFCDYSNEPLSCVRCGQIVDKLRNCNLLKRHSAPWSVLVIQLVSQSVSQSVKEV